MGNRGLEYVCCNLCGADSTKLWGRKHGLNIVKCRECGLIYTNPRLSNEQLKQYYGSQYLANRAVALYEERGRMYDIEIRQMLKIIGTHGRFLDVGCSNGRFLSHLPTTFDKYGIEFSEEAAIDGRERFGLDIKVGQLVDNPFENNFFDMVQFRGVLEHLQDPQRDLEASYSILKNGGWLILSTIPNTGGPCGRIYKQRFKLVYPREHIYYFSAKTLSRYCKKNGFQVEHIFYPYLGTPYANLVRDLFFFVANFLTGRESPPFPRSVITIFARKVERASVKE